MLQEPGEVLFLNDREIVGDNGLTGLFGIVRTEDQYALAVEQEGIEVGDADAFAGEDLDGVRSLAGSVVERDCEFPKIQARLFPVVR